MKPTNINRRDFIKKSGMLLAATSVPSFLQAGEKQPTLSIKNQKIAIDSQWDVIVVGGGPAGCTAATAAAREGAKTLLIEATGQLGGMGTTGMIPAWCPFSDGEKIIYRGLAEKVFRAAKKGVPHEPADKLDWVSINPEQLMTVYDDMVCSSGAKVLFFSRLADVEMASDDTIEAIIVANKNGLTAFKAKVFVDCTGDGDLSVWAGANYFMGNNSDQVQLSTLCFSVANVDSYGYTTNPNLYWENKDSPIHDALKSGKYPLIDQHSCNNLIGPSVVQFNAGHIAMTNSTDPWQISDAMVKGERWPPNTCACSKITSRKCMGTHLSSRPLHYWEYAKAGASRATMCSRFKIGWTARASTTRLAGIATSWIYTSKATKPSITDEASRTVSPTGYLLPKA